MSVEPIKKSDTAMAEERLMKLWQEEKILDQVKQWRQASPYFSFYDGPPFASGEPHYGHLEQSTVKDAVARYKTMQGFQVPRRIGWDTHGLPIEYIIEKDLGLNSKKDIVEYGIDKFNNACRDIVFRHQSDFIQMYARMGRWIDSADAYATLDNSFMESVWWALSQLNQKDLLYRGFKSMPYCPRCQTPLSNFELNEGYKDNVPDPSVYVLFPLSDDPKTSLLAWTTTPWTLPANAALAVDAKADYAYVKLANGSGTLILAKDRLEVMDLKKAEYSVSKTVKGQDLIGLKYQPLYLADKAYDTAKDWQVYADKSVDLGDGTGILHVAPRYGESDLDIGQREGLPLIESVDATGHMVQPAFVKGQFFKSADEHIIADLTKAGRIFAAETFTHTYPFCWRCDTPLMYFATTTWFVAVTKIRDQLTKNAKDIHWVPAHIKSNRFGKWLEGARDWAISRNRYWGNPLPIWVNEDDEDDYLVIGSLEELKKLSGGEIGDDLHRPHIDKVVIKKAGKTYKRVEEVLDCWFESGSMSYAQDHYPFENKEMFEQKFPADFIVEGMDQVRLWFYTLHVMATTVFDKPAYKNVVADGLVLAADGKKLSKRLRNYPPIDQLLDKYGADTVRFFMLASPLMNAEDTRLDDNAFRDINRNLLMTLRNSFSFFKTYADVDKWQAPAQLTAPDSDNVMDQWIISRLSQTTLEVTTEADKYHLNKATRPLLGFVDDLSNWYIRRSRRRFWKSQNDKDKEQAYATLHYVLSRTCQLLAPWTPFLADELWRQINPEQGSVHLTDWPKPDKASTQVLENMEKTRMVIEQGLAQRASAGVKVRQPLASVTLSVLGEVENDYLDVIKDELNVKEVITKPGKEITVKLDIKLTDELKAEGLMREVVRHIQAARKQAGLKVDDRIKLMLQTESEELKKAIITHQDTIFTETLATAELDEQGDYSGTVQVEGQPLQLSLSKA